MKTSSSKVLVALLTGLLWFGATSATEAAVRVYKITYVSKATVNPAYKWPGYSTRVRGYLIIDTNNPSDTHNFKVVDIYGKVYSDLGSLGLEFKRQVLKPFLTLDRSNNGKLDTVLMYEDGIYDGFTYSGLFLGTIPSKGFKVKGVPFVNEARTLRYRGSKVREDVDFWRRNATLRLDPIVVDNPQPTVGLQYLVLKARLKSKGYVEGF